MSDQEGREWEMLRQQVQQIDGRQRELEKNYAALDRSVTKLDADVQRFWNAANEKIASVMTKIEDVNVSIAGVRADVIAAVQGMRDRNNGTIVKLLMGIIGALVAALIAAAVSLIRSGP